MAVRFFDSGASTGSANDSVSGETIRKLRQRFTILPVFARPGHPVLLACFCCHQVNTFIVNLLRKAFSRSKLFCRSGKMIANFACGHPGAGTEAAIRFA